MDKQKFIRAKLKEFYLQIKLQNPNFSERALARKIGIGPSTISEFQAGKRFLSVELLTKISQFLKLSALEAAYFESLPFKERKEVFRVNEGCIQDKTALNILSSLSDKYFQNIVLNDEKDTLIFRGDSKLEEKINRLRNDFIEKALMVCDNQDQNKVDTVFSVDISKARKI